MATLLLQAAGAYIGGLFGAVGATIGTAAGALGGYLIDRALINGTQHIKGARLSQMQPLTGEDGAPLARVYGTARLGGTLIWATRFEEASKTERKGAKGGPKVTTYSYYANFAVAICEGEIAHVRRIWADGRELDQSDYEIRIHKGSAGQLPDPLIEAKQGAGNAPAYRGTAYAVFDRFPLDNFGNRIPQVQFEVIRTLGGIEKDIRAITLIPGSTEFGLSPAPVIQTVREGETVILNRHNLGAETDWAASLDELQALCPNLESVALVVAWFGTDLRAGSCQIRPGVVQPTGLQGDSWRVCATDRANAHLVSDHDGKKAFGGTPDDASVIAAIRDIKARGLRVTLYPFVLMDISAVNSLPSPYGGSSQPAYPWRGEITCSPAPGLPGTADATATAAAQISTFTGGAQPSHFSASGEAVVWSGGTDWGYRRMVLHYAKLADIAGGVDAFLIGSEFKSLTRVRSATSTYPFVSALMALAADVRGMLGSTVKLTYAADWSEYGAYTPSGVDALHFPLDDLWAHAAIDAVGIDNYLPLSDWRDTHLDGSNPDGAESSSDLAALKTAITGGEGFGWFYASEVDRRSGTRTPITDGLAGKHWVYRAKDFAGWWSNQHFPRAGGAELPTPTAWVAHSKPIWFTELGCPAVDKAANQPNVFPDPKSAAAALPHFSDGGRDDLVQNRFLAAHFAYWADAAHNPVSPVYGGPMIDMGNANLWAWDARPYPSFPLSGDVWGDGGNWLTGHWLNGRLSGATLDGLVTAILEEHGISSHHCKRVDGFLSGFVLNGQTTAREALDQLLGFWRVDVCETGGKLTFRSRSRALPQAVDIPDIAFNKSDGLQTLAMFDPGETAGELTLAFRDELRDHQQTTVLSAISNGNRNAVNIEMPGSMDPGLAQAQLRQAHRDMVARRGTVSFQTGWRDAALAAGDLVRLGADQNALHRIQKVSDGHLREIEAELAFGGGRSAARSTLPGKVNALSTSSGRPWHVFMDLPRLNDGDVSGLQLAAWSKPWSPVLAYMTPGSSGYGLRATLTESATAGFLESPLPEGHAGRWDIRHTAIVRLFDGALAGADAALVLGGANAAAVRAANGAWEIMQFAEAEETAPGLWRLSGLLRGQLGTDDAANAGAATGAEFVVLDNAVVSAGLSAEESGLVLNWKVGPAGKDFTDRYFAASQAGPSTRDRLSYAPAHLKAISQSDGSVGLRWIRRSAVGGDGWDAAEIPLPEGSENYQIRVLDASNQPKRLAGAAIGTWTYFPGDILADFGPGVSVAVFEVSQLGANGLPGIPSRTSITVQT